MDDATSPSLDEALTSYCTEHLASRNFALNTRLAYQRDLRDLAAFLAGHGHLTHPGQVAKFHLEQYLGRLDSRGLKGSSRRRRVASIKSFFGFLQERGWIEKNPAERLAPPEREYRQRRVLTEAEYKKLLQTVQYEPRDRALIELILQTGLRLSEVATLTLAQISLPARISKDPGNVGAVSVHGKGRKSRTITLNWKACGALKAYLDTRRHIDDPHVFLTKFKEGMKPRAIQRAIEKHLKEAGIPGVSVHTLRHTFAMHSYARGTKLGVIQKALGHSSLATTSIYAELAREMMDKELQENAL